MDPITSLNATDSLAGSSRAALNTNFTQRLWMDRTATDATPYTVAAGDEFIEYTAAAASVIDLPSAASNDGRTLWVWAVSASSANTITVTPNLSDTVGGAATFVMNGTDENVWLMSDGVSDWRILKDGR